MSTWDDVPAFVLDSGSGVVKCGFAGEEVPRGVFAAAVGRPRGQPDGPFTVGDSVTENGGAGLTVRYPIEHGIVNDWDGLELLWRKGYETCEADPSSRAVLVTEAPMNPKSNREGIMSLLFEKFQVPAANIQIQAVLSLYSVGRVSGCVLDSGDGVSHAVPVYDGHTVPTAIQRLDMAGRDMTEWLMQLLTDETDHPFTTTADREAARDIKEKLCYVAQDFDKEMDVFLGSDEAAQKAACQPYTLPDGTELSLGRSLISCAEAMFEPSYVDRNQGGIQHLIHRAINGCGIDVRRPLFSNIVLCGGNTMFKGLDTRLEAEVRHLVNKSVMDDVKVIAPNERKFSVWMGAAILASLTSFLTEWITKEEYEEHGPNIVHRRCSSYGFVEK